MQTPQDQIAGGVWPLASSAEKPEISIQDWEIHEVQLPDRKERTRHVVGLVGWHREGVVSSAITELDTATHTAKTESGRVYILGTRTGGNLDSEYVWNRWLRINNATGDENVTADVKELLTVVVVDWQIVEHPHENDPRRKILHVSGAVQDTGAKYACDVERLNRTAMEGVDANGRFFKLVGHCK